MPIIVLASSKGGVGKTTIAMALAHVFANSKATTTLIDADPNAPMKAWADKSDQLPPNLSLITGVGEDDMVETIDKAAETSAFVIIDLEGSANLAMAYALGRADLALIPIQGSQLDANEAGKVVRLIERQENHLKRAIPRAGIISRAPFIQPRTAKHIRTLIEQLGVQILEKQLHERDAFRAIFTYGGSLYDLTPEEVANPDKACANAEDVAQAVITYIRENQNGR